MISFDAHAMAKVVSLVSSMSVNYDNMKYI